MKRPAVKVSKKEQARRTREKILEKAIGLFAHQGFVSTSTQDIAKAVGMTPGVLYWHFKSKEDLLAAVLDHLLTVLFEDITHVGAKIDWSDPSETLAVLVERVSKIAEGHQDYMLLIGVVSAEATDTNPRIEEAVRAAYRRLASLMESLLVRGQARGYGHQPPMEDLECAAQIFMGLFMGGVLHQRLFRKEFPLARALPVLRRMLFASAFPGAASSKSAPKKKKSA